MKRRYLLLLFLFLLVQPGCIWKLWTKSQPKAGQVYDVYGTVVSITPEQLVIETNNKRKETFEMVTSSIKGSDFGPGATVHVFYKEEEGKKVVTMVVEKIK